MTIKAELSRAELVKLVLDHLSEKLNVKLTESDVKIETRSKQNYRSEWEIADFRANVLRTDA